MTAADALIKRLRALRAEERALRATLVSDLKAFQKPEDLSFFTLPTSDKKGISVASTCTALMALVDSNRLGELIPDHPGETEGSCPTAKEDGKSASGSVLEAESKTAPKELQERVPGQTAGEQQPRATGATATQAAQPPNHVIKDLFSNVVAENWASSGLEDLNAFTTCMVIRAAGFLVSAQKLNPADLMKMTHAIALKNEPLGKIALAFRDKKEATFEEIVHAVAKEAEHTFSVPKYPPKTTMAYWFVHGIDNSNIQLKTEAWTKIGEWATEEFGRQLTYVASDNESLMDPAALAMTACLISRIRRVCGRDPQLSSLIQRLPALVELKYAVREVFGKQSESGIWHKYFPLFHFPGSGAADYTFSPEFLEAILLEFSEFGILEDERVLEGIEKAVHWCKRNRLKYPNTDFYGWNAGGDLTNVAAEKPEAWATAAVHMFLWELESALSHWLQTLVLKKLARNEKPQPQKWDELIDVDIKFPPNEQSSLKDITEREILQYARGRTEKSLRDSPLKDRRSALLFGPPGTSKTSFTEAVAGQLGWPLIIINPSEFLGDGLERIYVRVSEIFDDLSDLSGVVVLFDEMDALAQTRVNPALDVTRQLLTTSMLPKLADLYKKGTVVFFMATNHRKDLDPAITRPGRFDLLLCVGPPSWSRKLAGIGQALKGLRTGNIDKVKERLSKLGENADTKNELDFFTVGDLRSFMEHLRRRNNHSTLEAALNPISEDTFQSSVTLWAKSYITLAEEEAKLHDHELTAREEYMTDKEKSRIQ